MAKDENGLKFFSTPYDMKKSEKLSNPSSGCLNSKNFKAENKFFQWFQCSWKIKYTKSALGMSV